MAIKIIAKTLKLFTNHMFGAFYKKKECYLALQITFLFLCKL